MRGKITREYRSTAKARILRSAVAQFELRTVGGGGGGGMGTNRSPICIDTLREWGCSYSKKYL